jgi:hypothetical protein
MGNQPIAVSATRRHGLLKELLTRFTYGAWQAALKSVGMPTDAEMAERNAQLQNIGAQTEHLNAQTKLTNAQAELTPVTVNGMTFNLPAALAQKLMTTQLTEGGKNTRQTNSLNSKESIANNTIAARNTPALQFGQDFINALQSGDEEGAKKALDSMNQWNKIAKPAGSPYGKVDPIISAYLGPMPDPTTDPAGARSWAADAEKIKTRMAVAPRVAGYAALNMGRIVQGYDPATDNYTFATAGQAIHDGLLPAGLAFKNMPKVAQFGEMQTASGNLRQSIINLDRDFTPEQRMKLQMATASPSEGILANQIHAFLGSEQLTPSQQDYVIWLKQMNERLLSLRNVAGMGQGAEDMRRAIQATLPNVTSANKAYALKQLDATDQQIESLYQGVGGKSQVPKVPKPIQKAMHKQQGNIPEYVRDPVTHKLVLKR